MKESGTNNLVIAIWGVGSIVVLVIMVTWLRTYFVDVQTEVVYQTVLSVENPKLKDIQARDTEALNTYGWVDKEKGVVRIPIERAMELEVQQAGRNGQGR